MNGRHYAAENSAGTVSAEGERASQLLVRLQTHTIASESLTSPQSSDRADCSDSLPLQLGNTPIHCSTALELVAKVLDLNWVYGVGVPQVSLGAPPPPRLIGDGWGLMKYLT